jgi:hypothetical protein
MMPSSAARSPESPGGLPALNRDTKEAEEEHLPDVTEEDELVAFPEDGRE